MLTSVIRIALVLAVTAQFSFAGQGTWTSGGPYGGDVMAVAINPSTPTTIYSGTDGGGIFRSTDAGGTWTAVNSGLTSPNVRSLAINPVTPTTLYAGTVFGGGVFKSTNAGASWSPASTGLVSLNINSLAINPATPSTLYAATDDGIFTSTNDGASWAASNSGLTSLFVYSVVINPLAPATLYAGTNGGGIFKSVNGGGTWVAVNTGLSDLFVYTLAVDPATAGTLYAGTDSGVFKSTNAGGNWASANIGLSSLVVSVVAIAPSVSTTLYVTTTGGVFKSVDSGGIWTAASTGLPNQTVLALAINPTTSSTLYGGIGSGAGIFKSTNSGNSWAAANSGLTSVYVRALAVNPATPSTLYAGSVLSDGVFKSVNSGGSWTAANSGLTTLFVNALAIDPATPSTVYAGTSLGGVFKSTNAGGTWAASNTGLPTPIVYALAINPATPSTIYVATDEGVFKSINSGANWAAARSGLTSFFVVSLAIDPATPATLFAGTDVGVFKSTDSGANWTSAGLTTRLVNAIAIDPAASVNVYLGTDGGVFKSANSGGSWTTANTGLTTLNVLSFAVNPATPSTLYAGTFGGGVFTSANSAGSWTATNSGLTNPTLRVYALAANPAGSTLYAGLESGSVFRLSSAPSAPQVTTQPASQTVAPGGTASFSAAASGSPSPTVQWQVSTNSGASFADISGATSTTYSFTAALADTGKQYRAVFTNSAGTATTSAAVLTVSTTASAPSVTTHPSNQTVAPGGTASFSAAAAGSPTPTVQWQVSTNSGASFTDISGATSTTYSFTAALADAGRQYRAVFTNTAGSATTNAATLTVSTTVSGPSVTAHPANQAVSAGAVASFSAAAGGSPSPTVQWQVSANSGASFADISGATSTTFSLTTVAADHGKQFRAVFTNSAGSATSNAATLTVGTTNPAVALDRTSLVFSAVTSGTAFTAQTPLQTVRLSQSGPGTVTWTATSNAPWLVVGPISGSGPATLSIFTQFAPGLVASQTGTITLTLTGAANTVGPINVTLTTTPSTAPASLPFGVIDTPAGDGTALAGSVAFTGWTLDNIGVRRVELWRDLQAGETTPPFTSTPSDPRHGKVFIGNATFVDGARPDVEALNGTTPFAYRAGWGYLLLTWGLWNQGNGTYTFHAFAFDYEDNVATIGTKTVVINNNAATKPFGSIDTPAIGGDASGPNFGWALTPRVNGAATCTIPSNGVQVSIDSGPLQPVVYGDARTDIAGAFPGFSNSAGAGGHFIFDWSTLAPGTHTIGWLITDNCNRADGVGSRFFNVAAGGSAVTAEAKDFRLKAETSSDAEFRLKAETTETEHVASAFRQNDDAVLVSHGYGELPAIVTPDEAGNRVIEVKQGDRIEIRVPRGYEAAYQLVNAGRRGALPAGSTWDSAGGIFYWQPAPAFLGRYHIVFTSGTQRISVRVIVTP